MSSRSTGKGKTKCHVTLVWFSKGGKATYLDLAPASMTALEFLYALLFLAYQRNEVTSLSVPYYVQSLPPPPLSSFMLINNWKSKLSEIQLHWQKGVV